jgi:hypothetical protein
MIVGYARTLTFEQEAGLDAQVRELAAAGAERSVWIRVSPKPTIVSGRRAITRTGIGSPPAGVYTASIPNAANVAPTAPAKHRHQVRLPLISTRGRVQIGSGLDCTCSITQRANCWSTACLADQTLGVS